MKWQNQSRAPLTVVWLVVLGAWSEENKEIKIIKNSLVCINFADCRYSKSLSIRSSHLHYKLLRRIGDLKNRGRGGTSVKVQECLLFHLGPLKMDLSWSQCHERRNIGAISPNKTAVKMSKTHKMLYLPPVVRLKLLCNLIFSGSIRNNPSPSINLRKQMNWWWNLHFSSVAYNLFMSNHWRTSHLTDM